MRRIMISAMHSGAGKTIISCGLMAAYRRRGLAVRAFKCGPDYIDPMFHSRVLGVPSRNLDLFLQGEEGVKRTLFSRERDRDMTHECPVDIYRSSVIEESCKASERAEIQRKETAAQGPAMAADFIGSGVPENAEPPALAILEGAMGFYDGVAGTDAASAWDVARVTETPVILAVKPGGSSLTLAAQVKGLMEFRPESRIAGIILANTKEPMFLHLKPVLERETGLPVLGWLPAMAEAKLPSRHLGLLTAEEVTDLQVRFAAIAEQMERTVDLDRILGLAERREGALAWDDAASEAAAVTAGNVTQCGKDLADRGAASTAIGDTVEKDSDAAAKAVSRSSTVRGSGLVTKNTPAAEFVEGRTHVSERFTAECSTAARGAEERKNAPVRIAVARDEAFCFIYADSLDALVEAGAELAYFCPLRDARLPEGTCGLYLCGGYPELHAKQLSGNESLRREIRSCIAAGLPTLAECGGFLYLQNSLEDEDREEYPMCGVFSGRGILTRRLQRFGYQYLRAGSDSMLFRAGERIPAHEFHYWDCTENGSDLRSEKPDGRSWNCGYVSPSLYAAFPHLHLGGDVPLAERFVEACRRYTHPAGTEGEDSRLSDQETGKEIEAK